MRRQRHLSRTLAFCAALALAAGSPGCGSDTKPTRDTSKPEDIGPALDAADGGVNGDTGTVQDTGAELGDADSGTAGPDTAPVGDVGVVDTQVACTSDEWCVKKLAADGKLSACQTAVCNTATGACSTKKKANTCCGDEDCKPPTPCVTGKCKLDTNVCVFEPIQDAPKDKCGGNLVMVDEGFEQGCNPLPPDWSQKPAAGSGNVHWHCSTNRAHGGKYSLYLGNECRNYDTSSTEANGCEGSKGTQVQVQLASKEAIVPKGEQAIAHFWLWLDTESLWTASDPIKKAAGKTPLQAGVGCKMAAGAEPNKCSAKAKCAFGQTCVKLPDSPDQCLDERDNLKLYVRTGGTKVAIWDASCVGQTTAGKWVHQMVDITPFLKASQGTAFKLVFEFDTLNGSLNTYEGAYIDDFRVETFTVGAGTVGAGDLHDCGPSKACPATKDNGCDIEACTSAVNLSSTLGLCFYDRTPGCCQSTTDCDDKNACTIDTCDLPKGSKQGTCSNKPDAANPQCCQPSSTFKETFDVGAAGNWTTSDCPSKSVKWHTTKNSPYKGAQSLCFSDPSGIGYDDPSLKPNWPRCTICSPKVKISAGTVYNQLKFALRMQTEFTGAKTYLNPNPKDPNLVRDFLTVFVKDAGHPVVLWDSHAIKGTTPNGGKDWVVLNSYALQEFAGKEKEICFSFDTGDPYGNKTGGVCIDDIEVAVTCAKQLCQTDAQARAACPGKPCMETRCSAAFGCEYVPIPNCCQSEKDCDDGNVCTTDKCGADNTCVHTSAEKDCCAVMSRKDKNAPLAEDFESGKLGSGWKTAVKTGQPKYAPSLSYSKNHTWQVSKVRSRPGTGTYSLYFGKQGTYNAGTAVPAATADSPPFALQGSSKANHIVSFDLFLATEWDDYDFKKPPFDDMAIDRLLVLARDTADPKAKWLTVWDSYDIEGTTHGKWRSIVAAIPASLAGKTIRLRLDFDAGNDKHNQYEGAYIDNLAAQTLCNKPVCSSVKDCAGTDKCKSYFCGLDDTTGAPACSSIFKPGPGCCAPELLLPIETGEGGKLDSFEAGPAVGSVKWHVVKKANAAGIPTYLSGKAEIRFGSTSKPDYMAGSGKSCTQSSDCTGDEKCVKDKAGKPGCYLPVSGKLQSKPITPPAPTDGGLELRFDLYADIEPAFETFQVWAVSETGVTDIKKLWDHKTALKAGDYKSVQSVKVDLSALQVGTKFRIQFRFDSNDPSKNDQFLGVHLDNIAIERTCK